MTNHSKFKIYLYFMKKNTLFLILTTLFLSGCSTTETFKGYSEKGYSCVQQKDGSNKCYVFRIDEDPARFHKLTEYEKLLIDSDPDADKF